MGRVIERETYISKGQTDRQTNSADRLVKSRKKEIFNICHSIQNLNSQRQDSKSMLKFDIN